MNKDRIIKNGTIISETKKIGQTNRSADTKGNSSNKPIAPRPNIKPVPTTPRPKK